MKTARQHEIVCGTECPPLPRRRRMPTTVDGVEYEMWIDGNMRTVFSLCPDPSDRRLFLSVDGHLE
ncbi:hypothetical protein NDR87_16700 [Nocardia sp. CDC159]|uniref:Uncharacterized protein n=1 Tax=Nocardia pulmonis TaxID=2951408 RepID=A0A9X2E7Y2_9NOCA|nr:MULTISPECIES: hypothetical protein [Nocardia]MCM6775266.1 hypothetical protein [Nocardia pulmonis]MCM6788000.1 hypothetical protein [Nocardia sp. CDC159]